MEHSETLIHQLVDLYLSARGSNVEGSCSATEEDFESQRNKLLQIDPSTLLGYIKEIVEGLVKTRKERRSAYNSLASDKEVQEDYEPQIQKLEAEVRSHIRLEQQLKLHVDSMQAKLEDHEKTIDKLNKTIKRLETKLQEASTKVVEQTSESDRLKKILYEKIKRISILEKNVESIKQHSKLNITGKSDASPSKGCSEQERSVVGCRATESARLVESAKKQSRQSVTRPSKLSESYAHLRSSSHRDGSIKEDNKSVDSQCANNKEDSKRGRSKEGTKPLQRNSTIDNFIKNLERQNQKSKFLVNNRPCSTYRERSACGKGGRLALTTKISVKVVQKS